MPFGIDRLFDGEGRDDGPFFVETVRVADRDAVFSGRLVDQRQQVGFLAVFLGREAQPFQFVGFHAAERADRGQFGKPFLLVGLESEDVDDRDRVGGVVHGLDDEPDVVVALETHGRFGGVDDELRLGLADAEDLGAGIRPCAEQDGLFFEFGRVAVGQDGDDLTDEIGFGDLGRLCESTAKEQPEEGCVEKLLHSLNRKKAFSRTNIDIACFYNNFSDNFPDRTYKKSSRPKAGRIR